MTEIAAVSVAGASLLTGAMAVAAVIDPSIVNITGVVVGAIVAIAIPWIAYKTKLLDARVKAQDEKQKMQDDKIKAQDIKVAEVIKTTDGMKDALVRETAKASLAEGVVKGQRAAAADAAIHAAGVLEGQQISIAISAVPKQAANPAILNKIEKNTAETADNTAKTDAAVQEIQQEQKAK